MTQDRTRRIQLDPLPTGPAGPSPSVAGQSIEQLLDTLGISGYELTPTEYTSDREYVPQPPGTLLTNSFSGTVLSNASEPLGEFVPSYTGAFNTGYTGSEGEPLGSEGDPAVFGQGGYAEPTARHQYTAAELQRNRELLLREGELPVDPHELQRWLNLTDCDTHGCDAMIEEQWIQRFNATFYAIAPMLVHSGVMTFVHWRIVSPVFDRDDRDSNGTYRGRVPSRAILNFGMFETDAVDTALDICWLLNLARTQRTSHAGLSSLVRTEPPTAPPVQSVPAESPPSQSLEDAAGPGSGLGEVPLQ